MYEILLTDQCVFASQGVPKPDSIIRSTADQVKAILCKAQSINMTTVSCTHYREHRNRAKEKWMDKSNKQDYQLPSFGPCGILIKALDSLTQDNSTDPCLVLSSWRIVPPNLSLLIQLNETFIINSYNLTYM